MLGPPNTVAGCGDSKNYSGDPPWPTAPDGAGHSLVLARPSLVRNGDFESALGTNNGGPWVVPANMAGSGISNALGHSGSRSLHVAATSPGGGPASSIYQDTLPVATSTTYTLSYWFLAGTNGGNLTVRLYPGSLLNNTVELFGPVAQATPGRANSAAGRLPPYPPVWLNEVQPSHTAGLTDNHGQHEPWVELHNAGTNTVDLGGFFLANNFTNLTQGAFPAGTLLPPGAFQVVFADAQPDASTAAELHANFRLSTPGGSLALSRLVKGLPQILDYVRYPSLAADWSYGSVPDGQPFDRLEMFHAPPGGTNNGAAAPLRVLINEWMAGNTGFVRDPADNAAEDWFELFNPGTNNSDLQ